MAFELTVPWSYSEEGDTAQYTGVNTNEYQ